MRAVAIFGYGAGETWPNEVTDEAEGPNGNLSWYSFLGRDTQDRCRVPALVTRLHHVSWSAVRHFKATASSKH